MPRGGKRNGAGRPKFNDDNPTTYWVVLSVLFEINRDALGRYQRMMARQSSFSKAKKAGTPIDVKALQAMRETVELKEEITQLESRIAGLMNMHGPGATEISQLRDDLEEIRDIAVPDAWGENSPGGGLRVFIEGGIKPTHFDMGRYFQNVAERSKECPTGPKDGMDRYQIKELWNRYREAVRKSQIKGSNT